MPTPKRPARREPLSAARIADAALALVDADGLADFSMRKLGARLGVEAMALYHHFPAKGALMDAVMDRLLDEIDLPPRGSVAPLERLRRCMASWRGAAIRHPRAYLLLAGRRFNTERAFAFYEDMLQSFADLGLDARASARWFRLLGGFVTGAGLAEVASREKVPDATPLRLEHAPDAIPYLHVRAVAPHLRVEALDGVFDFGMQVLFGALEAHVAAAGATRLSPPPALPRAGAARGRSAPRATRRG
jgi:AcrR family transcriptional regulator